MTLQEVFYLVGIIFLSIYSIILIGVIIAIFYLKNLIQKKIQSLKHKMTTTLQAQPENIARLAGAAIAQTILRKFSR